MNHPITWGDYINVRLMLWVGGVVFLFVVGTIAAIVRHHEDMHVNDEPKETFEPHAGKTLGL